MSHRSPLPNYKTVKLSRGKHTSPADGVCVMELSSMIAGEPFSDQPLCVCPVIAAFLRAYNDSLDDRRRQDLYRYAAEVVDTRDAPEVERLRIERVVEWARDTRASRNRLIRLLRRVDLGLRPAATARSAASLAVNAIGRRTELNHRRALALVDELCAIRSSARLAAGRPGILAVNPRVGTEGRLGWHRGVMNGEQICP